MAYNEDVNVNLNILAGAMGGITAIAGGMSALTSTFGQFGTTAVDTFGTLDGLVVSAAALVGTFAVQAASAAGEFEQGMKIVQAVSGQTGSAISQLGEEANKLSIEYRTAIGDITEGLQTLGRAGLNSADTQLDVLESGLQTAKLEGRNLNGVLEELIQNTAMLGGNLDSIDFGSQTEYVNSLMVGTSMSAPIDTHDISQTLQYVGGTAAAAGANLEDKEKLEDLMGTIAAFAQKGVTGSMAGTALRAFLTKPASQDKSVVTGLEALGLSPEDLWEDGGESMKDISDQIALIQHQMDQLNLSTMDQLEIWGKIVGPKMGQQMMKLEADKIKDLTSDIQQASSAEELATSTLSTYNQKVNEMGQLADVVFRGVGSKFLMFLNPIIEGVNFLLELMSHPAINTAVFVAVFSLISHGIQKAISMVRSLFGQIKEAVSGITTAIQSINSPMNQATASAASFKNEIYQIIEATNAMNTNIAQTGTLSGAMQAHLLGKQANRYIPGFENDKTLDRNVVGVNDSYRQYFQKPQKTRTYTGTLPRSAEQLKKDMFAFSKFREEMRKYNFSPEALMNAAVDRGIISAPLDEKTGQGLKTAPLLPATISEEEYQALSKKDKKRFTANDPYYVSAGHNYIPTQEYNELDAATKKQYESQNYRLMARHGTEEQLNREIDESTKKLRVFNGTAEEWEKLSAGEKLAIQKQTEEFRAAKAKELKSMKVEAGEDAFGRKMYGYATMHNIPQSKTLAELMSIEGKQKGGALNAAIHKQMATEMMDSYKKSLGVVGRIQQSGLNKLGRSIDVVTSGFGRLRTGMNNFRTYIGSEGGSLRGAFRRIRDSVMSESGGIRTAFRQARNNILTNFSFTGIKTQLAIFGSQLGLSSATLESLSASATAQMASVSALETEFSSVGALIQSLAKELKITDEQFVQLIASSEVLQKQFSTLAAQKGFNPKEVGDAMSGVQKQGGRLSRAFGGLIGALGGPVSAAFMGLTVAIQIAQEAFQKWQQRLQEAITEMQEAQSKAKEAQEGIKETFKNENSDLTEAQLELAVDAQYISMYDTFTGDQNLDNLGASNVEGDIENGIEGFSVASEENQQALRENTMALAEATEAYSRAESKGITELTDPTFGMAGMSSDITDQLGEIAEMSKIADKYNTSLSQSTKIADGFINNQGPVLTGSQKDDKYAGSKEFAPIMIADAYRFGTEQGLRQFFGSDYETIINIMSSMDSKLGYESSQALKTHAANFAPQGKDGKGLDYRTQAEMQMQLKNYKPLYQRLGREMYSYEKSGGFNRKAYNDYLRMGQDKKQGKTNQKEYKELRSIENIIKRIRAETGTKLSDANILAMGQLQQLQDMYTVAQQQVAPGIQATVDSVSFGNTIAGGISGEVGGSGSGAVTAGANAGAIAAMLGAMAQEQIGHKAHTEWLGTAEGQHSDDKSYEAFLAKANVNGSQAQDLYYKGMGEWAYRVEHPNAGYKEAADAGERRAGYAKEANQQFGTGLKEGLATLTSPAMGIIKEQVQQAYEQSGIGTPGSTKNPSGSGGGGDGGSGSDKGNSDSGNKKNRVDLVLCNKKEIPKLNVNLFKKEPSFTVLNKNFKLRDIKINTQDTPKSILSAVKNGIIDTAKRMDPKIIQDGESVYDPVGATEGKDTPSGTTPTSSN